MCSGGSGGRAYGSATFPWSRPGHELLLLALVAVAVLVTAGPCVGAGWVAYLSERGSSPRATVERRLFSQTVDRASYGGHLYSDKAPGLSVLEMPAVAMLRPGSPHDWSQRRSATLGGARALGRTHVPSLRIHGGKGERRACAGLRGNRPGELRARDARGASCGREFRVRPGGNARVRSLLARLESASGTCRPPWRSGAPRRVRERLDLSSRSALYVALGGWRPLLAFVAGLVPAGLLLGATTGRRSGRPGISRTGMSRTSGLDCRRRGSSGSGCRTVSGSPRSSPGGAGCSLSPRCSCWPAFGLVWLGRTHRAEAFVAATVTAIFVLTTSATSIPTGADRPGLGFSSRRCRFSHSDSDRRIPSALGLTLVSRSLGDPDDGADSRWAVGGPARAAYGVSSREFRCSSALRDSSSGSRRTPSR